VDYPQRALDFVDFKLDSHFTAYVLHFSLLNLLLSHERPLKIFTCH
jgi:hypothetical protein